MALVRTEFHNLETSTTFTLTLTETERVGAEIKGELSEGVAIGGSASASAERSITHQLYPAP